MGKAQFRTRHLEWFHNANSAENLIAATNPREHIGYCMEWLQFALANLEPLVAELRDAKLAELVEVLRKHYLQRSEESKVSSYLAQGYVFGKYSFLRPLRMALYTVKDALHLLPESEPAEFREVPKDDPGDALWTGLPCSRGT